MIGRDAFLSPPIAVSSLRHDAHMTRLIHCVPIRVSAERPTYRLQVRAQSRLLNKQILLDLLRGFPSTQHSQKEFCKLDSRTF